MPDQAIAFPGAVKASTTVHSPLLHLQSVSINLPAVRTESDAWRTGSSSPAATAVSQYTTSQGHMLTGLLEFRLSKQLQSLLNQALMFPDPGGFPFCFWARSARYTQEMGLSKNSNTHGKGWGEGKETQAPKAACSHIQTSAENCSPPTFNNPRGAKSQKADFFPSWVP